MAVPRVLGVDVMGRAVGLAGLLQALHLDKAGHSQGIPVRKGCGQVFRIAEVPLAIQADGQGQFGACLVRKMGVEGRRFCWKISGSARSADVIGLFKGINVTSQHFLLSL